jgi:sn-glycerol 3-phosphate transport system ATP-binding protein
VQKAAKILELGTLLQRKPRALSGGQRQRVAMGRAIVREPAVFLFDEPLSNLDAKLRVQMRFEIQKLHRRLGTTSLYVTHDQVEAMTLAQRMLVINAGRAEQIGTPMDVYEDPATQFVAGFIGSPSMNFLAGRSEGGGRIVLADGGAVGHAGGTAAAGRGVTVGIRPEHLEPCGETEAMFAATVELVEHLGADTLVHLAHGADLLTARLPHGANPGVGSTMFLTAAPGKVYLFDAETGARIR